MKNLFVFLGLLIALVLLLTTAPFLIFVPLLFWVLRKKKPIHTFQNSEPASFNTDKSEVIDVKWREVEG